MQGGGDRLGLPDRAAEGVLGLVHLAHHLLRLRADGLFTAPQDQHTEWWCFHRSG